MTARTLGASLAFAVAVLVAWVPGKAIAAPLVRPCATNGTTTLAANAKVRLYRLERRSAVYGCLRRSNCRRFLSYDDLDTPLSTFTVRGTIAGYAAFSCDRSGGPATCRALIIDVELTTGRKRTIGPIKAARIPVLHLAGRRRLAFSAQRSDGKTTAIFVRDLNGVRLAAQSSTIDARSLRIINNVASWLDDGRRQQTELA